MTDYEHQYSAPDYVTGHTHTVTCSTCGQEWQQDFRARAGGRTYCNDCKPRRGRVWRNVHRLVSGAYAVIRWVRDENGRELRLVFGVDFDTPEAAAKWRDRLRDEETGQERLPGVD